MKLVVASNNSGKIREFKQLLGGEVISMAEAGINTEIPETGATFEENALIKARAVYKLCKSKKIAVIADDSGLEVDYLGGEPGVYSARYAPVGQRRAKVLEKMSGVPVQGRTARFVCCICYKDKKREFTVRGECRGHIGFESKGEGGFGYDSIFLYGGMSFAELSEDEKNAVSHRSRALRELIKTLNGG